MIETSRIMDLILTRGLITHDLWLRDIGCILKLSFTLICYHAKIS